MLRGRKVILIRNLDEASMSGTFRKQDDLRLIKLLASLRTDGGRHGVGPTENVPVEFLGTRDIQNGNFGPADSTRLANLLVWTWLESKTRKQEFKLARRCYGKRLTGGIWFFSWSDIDAGVLSTYSKKWCLGKNVSRYISTRCPKVLGFSEDLVEIEGLNLCETRGFHGSLLYHFWLRLLRTNICVKRIEVALHGFHSRVCDISKPELRILHLPSPPLSGMWISCLKLTGGCRQA